MSTVRCNRNNCRQSSKIKNLSYWSRCPKCGQPFYHLNNRVKFVLEIPETPKITLAFKQITENTLLFTYPEEPNIEVIKIPPESQIASNRSIVLITEEQLNLIKPQNPEHCEIFTRI